MNKETFSGAHPALSRALATKGYEAPTPVQAAMLDSEIGNRDVLVSAQTGSGKTVAYGIAMAETLLGTQERLKPSKKPLALVVAPTRELALQVQKELRWLFGSTGASVISCVGGMDIRTEARALEQGGHIVVGTPGRLCDHLERGRLNLSALQVVVLDEADEMLDLGFRENLELLLSKAPEEKRTLLFSATLPREIVQLAKRYQVNALQLNLVSKNKQHADIDYQAFVVERHDIDHAVVNLLRYFDAPGALVFCSTRERVRHLHGNLLERGFSVEALSGELSQRERSRALQSLRDGRARVCIATDVAARGLDLPDLGLVIHADLPRGPETLLHRSGRTGRAGKKGVCALVVSSREKFRAERLVGAASLKVQWLPAPSADVINKQDEERLVKNLTAFVSDPTPEDLAVAKKLLKTQTPESLAAALVRMHRGQLPAPEEISEVSRTSAPRERDGRGRRSGRNDRYPRENGRRNRR